MSGWDGETGLPSVCAMDTLKAYFVSRGDGDRLFETLPTFRGCRLLVQVRRRFCRFETADGKNGDEQVRRDGI